MNDKGTVSQNFEKLFRKAEETLQADTSAEQAVALLIADGEIKSFAATPWYGDAPDDLASLARELKKSGNTRVVRMICLWRSGLQVDQPSMALMKALLELDPGNRDTEFFVRRSDRYATRTIGASIPKKENKVD